MRPQLLLPLCWAFVVLGAPTLIPRTNTGGGDPAGRNDNVPPHESAQEYLNQLLPGEESEWWSCVQKEAGDMLYCLRVILDEREQPRNAQNDDSMNRFSNALDGFARKFSTNLKVHRTGFNGIAGKMRNFMPTTGSLPPILVP